MASVTAHIKQGGSGTPDGTSVNPYASVAEMTAQIVGDMGLTSLNLTANSEYVLCYVMDMVTSSSRQDLTGWTCSDPRNTTPGSTVGCLWFVGYPGQEANLRGSGAGFTGTGAASSGETFLCRESSGYKYLLIDRTTNAEQSMREFTGSTYNAYVYCEFNSGTTIASAVETAITSSLFQGCKIGAIVDATSGSTLSIYGATTTKFVHCTMPNRILGSGSTTVIIESCLVLYETDYPHYAANTMNSYRSTYYVVDPTTAADAEWVLDVDTANTFAVDMDADGWFTDATNDDYRLTSTGASADGQSGGGTGTDSDILSADVAGNTIGASASYPGCFQYVAAGGGGIRHPFYGPFGMRTRL